MKPGPAMRAFIAVDLDQAIRRKLGRLIERLRGRCPRMQWGDAGKIHLTLKFLGEVEDRQIEPIARALDQVGRRLPPFEIAVESVGTFPERGPVRVVWVGVRDVEGKLVACQAACEELIEPLGFPRENRAFSPHLTLARNRDARAGAKIREAIATQPALVAGTQLLEELVLYESVLGAGGARYTALSRHELMGKGASHE